jgi:tripeptidyl-peptidase I
MELRERMFSVSINFRLYSHIYSATYSVVEYTPQTYIQSDLDLLFSTLGLPIPAGTGPSPFVPIDGGELQFQEEDFSVNGESNLDLSYAIGLRKSQEILPKH